MYWDMDKCALISSTTSNEGKLFQGLLGASNESTAKDRKSKCVPVSCLKVGIIWSKEEIGSLA